MIVGFAGSGSMAAAIARGWASSGRGPERMLFTDSGSGRAAALAAELDGVALGSNRELAEGADLLVLAVKPAELDAVAAQAQGAGTVLSLLGATALSRVADAFPKAFVFRAMPNLGVEVGRGVICLAEKPGADDRLRGELRSLLQLLGRVVELDDSLFDTATAVMGCSPAYFALAVEAIADAGASDGLDREISRSLVVDTAAGTAELLRRYEPRELRSAVASPGGSTEAGLAALEKQDVGGAFAAAVRASLARMRG